MNALDALINPTISMNSLEISELVGLRHDNVKRTIKTLIKRGVIRRAKFEEVINKQSLSPNAKSKVYVFTGTEGKRDSIVVVAQLSAMVTARLVDRWMELEAQVAQRQLNTPQTLHEAIEREIARLKRLEALNRQTDAPEGAAVTYGQGSRVQPRPQSITKPL
jgi:phage regulator Rha-like protein